MGNVLIDIYKILFEAFAVGFLLAISCFLLFYRKKCNTWLLALTGAVIFMFAWRIGCFSLIRSTRYSVILIFPILIAVAWLCLRIGVVFRLYIPGKWGAGWRNVIGRLLPVLGVGGLILGCLGQILHFNSYDSWFKEVVQEYQKVASPRDILFVQNGYWRIVFYTRMPMKNVRLIPEEDAFPAEYISGQIEKMKNYPGKYYFFLFKRKGQPEFSSENLKLSPEVGSWKILERRFTSKRKNKEFLLAVFEAGCPNIEPWNKPIPSMAADDLYRGIGNFETLLSKSQQKAAERRFKNLGVSAYADFSNRPFPSGIWLGMSQADKVNPPDVRLQSENVLAGKYSLYVDGAVPKNPAGFNFPYLKQNFNYNFFVRGEGNKCSFLNLKILLIDLKSDKRKFVRFLSFRIAPGKVYRIFGQVDEPLASGKRYCPVVWSSGQVTLDQFSVTPVDEK